jgi:EF-P beta-lysylation protein EpmB
MARPAPQAMSSRPMPAWKRSLRTAIRNGAELLEALGISSRYSAEQIVAASRFPVLVPLDYLQRMRRGDAADPLLRQVLPLDAELASPDGYNADPVGDRAAEIAPGVIQKYQGRALLIVSGACAVQCRYCFRREYPYDAAPRRSEDWRPALERLAQDAGLSEIILSGGDPLMLPDDYLAALAGQIAGLPQVRRLRVHTRLPIVLPDRVTTELVRWLTGTRLTPVVVVHANHAAELAGNCVAALGRLVGAGIAVYNQSVLLAGVNDDADTQVELCERLIELRVRPYYLHQLDRVRGAAHFEVPVRRGLALYEQMRRRLPGYALPAYVREVPGAAGKLPVTLEFERE